MGVRPSSPMARWLALRMAHRIPDRKTGPAAAGLKTGMAEGSPHGPTVPRPFLRLLLMRGGVGGRGRRTSGVDRADMGCVACDVKEYYRERGNILKTGPGRRPARTACPARHSGRSLPPPVISTGRNPLPSFRPSGASGEIRPATGAGRTPEPVASTERPPGFSPSTSLRAGYSAPARRAGAPVEMTGVGERRPRAVDSGEAQNPPVIPAGAHPQPSFRPGATPTRHSGRAHPLPVISTERSEWRNPAGDGRRVDARACGVDGAPSGFLHSAPARWAVASVEMTDGGWNDGRWGGGCAPPLRATRNTQPSFRPSAPSPRHFGRAQPPPVIPAERTPSPSFRPSGASGETRPGTGAGRMPEPVASTERPPGFSTPPRPGGPRRRSK